MILKLSKKSNHQNIFQIMHLFPVFAYLVLEHGVPVPVVLCPGERLGHLVQIVLQSVNRRLDLLHSSESLIKLGQKKNFIYYLDGYSVIRPAVYPVSGTTLDLGQVYRCLLYTQRGWVRLGQMLSNLTPKNSDIITQMNSNRQSDDFQTIR